MSPLLSNKLTAVYMHSYINQSVVECVSGLIQWGIREETKMCYSISSLVYQLPLLVYL